MDIRLSNRIPTMVCFTCCIPSVETSKRRKIDRYSIGQPTEFRHISHLGSSAFNPNIITPTERSVNQPLPLHLKLIDLPTSISSPGEGSISTDSTSRKVNEDLLADLLTSIGRPPFFTYTDTNSTVAQTLPAPSRDYDTPTVTNSITPPSETKRSSSVSPTLRPSSHSLVVNRQTLDLSLPLPPPPPPPALNTTSTYLLVK